jgi:hypothetical protein
MDQLRATWNQKLEKEARDSDTRERVARELAAKLLPAQMPGSQPVGYQPQTSKPSNSGRKPRLSSEFVVFAGTLWRDRQGSNKRVRFGDLEWIAQQLDARKFALPGEYLEKRSAELLKRSNSKNADEALRWATNEGSRKRQRHENRPCQQKAESAQLQRLCCDLPLLAGNPASLASLRRPVRAAALAEPSGLITDLDSDQHPPRLMRS